QLLSLKIGDIHKLNCTNHGNLILRRLTMLIQCTRKLLDQLKIKPSEVPRKTQPLFSWHANILTINRRKTVVLVNDSNRYVVVLYGLLAKDFQKLDQLIFEAIIT